MNIDSSDDNIPTLTEIVATGDESMKSHFNGSFLDEITEETPAEDDIPELAVAEDSLEDALSFQAEAESDDIDPAAIEEPVIIEPVDDLRSLNIDELNETIKSLIDDALKETLPIIEQQLKQQLSDTIAEKLSHQLKG